MTGDLRSKLRVGILAPPWLAVPPPAYGGIEVAIDTLARGLVTAGHEVVLFTTGDSTCPVERSFILATSSGIDVGGAALEMHHVTYGYDALQGVDIVHDHTCFGPFYASETVRGAVVATNHNRFAGPFRTVFRLVADKIPVIAISHHHAATAHPIPIAAVIHHGLDPDRFPVGTGAGGYAMFLGRMSPEKGAHRALEIARASGVRLVLAGRMQTGEELAYFDQKVRPLLDGGHQYLGEVSQTEKLELLGGASFLLNPIAWDEPFGMVMIEAFACGTPVLTLAHGAAPEIVTDGATGFVAATADGLAAAVGRVDELDRRVCRSEVEGRFSSVRMVAAHVELYEQILKGCDGTVEVLGPPTDGERVR